MSHNKKVIHVIECLCDVVEIKAAIAWMLTHNPRFNALPIDMIDNRYEELLETIHVLKSGEPT
jgi:hypothetical protein